jgi:hypothetical protein
VRKTNKTNISDNILKIRTIDRILRNTELYTREELSDKSMDELQEIQDKGLIRLRLILEFKNREKRTF